MDILARNDREREKESLQIIQIRTPACRLHHAEQVAARARYYRTLPKDHIKHCCTEHRFVTAYT